MINKEKINLLREKYPDYEICLSFKLLQKNGANHHRLVTEAHFTFKDFGIKLVSESGLTDWQDFRSKNNLIKDIEKAIIKDIRFKNFK